MKGLLAELRKSSAMPDDESSDNDAMDVGTEGKQAALRAAFDAVKSDDFESFADAMGDYVEMCMNA